ncbi:homeobox protein SIX2-like [Stylophora pistillata]|uniref:homeobox protein SIX2-like n=1 Tax=Stylophora pistillata TaxID=50429 RepID=UPI000C0427ED|nr:homeobox protein SIX2-like [Stylophora pistillata]
MAYVLALRKGTSKRTKKKILLKNGEEGLLDRSTLATQWPTLPCLPFAGVRKTDRSRNTTSQSTSELQTWLDSFPGKVKENEKMIFKKIDEAWQRKDIDEMFQLIKENEFSDETQKKALHYWDQGHYYQEGEKRNKALTPLARFRIRERFLPPKNICPNGRKKATLPREATAKLRAWLNENPRPYPTRETKAALADNTGLTILQVNTWFANTRRRMRGKRKTERKHEVKSKDLWNRSR